MNCWLGKAGTDDSQAMAQIANDRAGKLKKESEVSTVG